MRWWALTLVWASWAGAVQAQAPETAPGCDGPATTLLQAVHESVRAGLGAQTPAQAVWQDGRRLRWPGQRLQAGQRVRLYQSDRAGLRLEQGRLLGADRVLALQPDEAAPPAPQLAYLAKLATPGEALALRLADRQPLPELVGQQLLALEDAQGRVLHWTALQWAWALDDRLAGDQTEAPLGVRPMPLADGRAGAELQLWAPTAASVAVCVYPGPQAPARLSQALQRRPGSGLWRTQVAGVVQGEYYRYLVELFQPGLGWVRHAVTDPYSVSLSADSQRSYVVDLAHPSLQPPGWADSTIPARVRQPTDMVIYELHVRDFSRDDATVPAAQRGKYLAFSEAGSAGMRHLRALAGAGLTDVHLLPIFDLATVPERGCLQPRVPQAAPDSPAQQAAVMAKASQDCFNWGYDPWHYSAPEGSFASDADNGAGRVRELRQMVMGLHAAGLRVGMDVVYNHTSAAGAAPHSVLDRIVPGYYQRLNARGEVERSTCCDNTATEHAMMGKLLIDSVLLWAREYKIASFRFDLMAHQPRALMERLQQRLRRELGREVQLLGEGWNFGEVANGARFLQASQLSLNGTGIGSFSDRGRDAVRGGSAGDDAQTSRQRPGFIIPAPPGDVARRTEQMRQADLLRVGLAGTLRSVSFQTLDGQARRGDQIAYGDQPAGYASQPAEVVNYVENHDNQTLFDALVLKLPPQTSAEERARTQVLALAINALSQGVAYFHAGGELLRSKSMDRNSYDSGDWFNRLDWRGQDNGFGAGLPPQRDNGADWPLLAPLLADARLKPGPAQIAWTSAAFQDWLRVRASTRLLRLDSAEQIEHRLRFYNTGPAQQHGLIVGRLDGQGLDGAGFARLIYLINANESPASIELPEEAGPWRLHPALASPQAADRRVAEQARAEADGRFQVPARSAVVFVQLP